MSSPLSPDPVATTHHGRHKGLGAVLDEPLDDQRQADDREGREPPHCPTCGKPVRRQSATQIVDQLLTRPEGVRLEVLAPLVRGRKGEFRELFEDMLRKGFVRDREI